jgi:hypothetical protein
MIQKQVLLEFTLCLILDLMSIETWANERAANNGMAHSFRIPSDIKPGTYVLRTELIALHGNALSPMPSTLVSGPETYPYCFNIEVTGNGTATPNGVVFPGGYKNDDKGLTFAPHYGAGSGVEHNSKYVSSQSPTLLQIFLMVFDIGYSRSSTIPGQIRSSRRSTAYR